jgi:hypothetical protein
MILKDCPDLSPVMINVYYHEGQEPGYKGVLTSQHIGVKVFLNSISSVFGFAPTKVRIFKAYHNEKNVL